MLLEPVFCLAASFELAPESPGLTQLEVAACAIDLLLTISVKLFGLLNNRLKVCR